MFAFVLYYYIIFYFIIFPQIPICFVNRDQKQMALNGREMGRNGRRSRERETAIRIYYTSVYSNNLFIIKPSALTFL